MKKAYIWTEYRCLLFVLLLLTTSNFLSALEYKYKWDGAKGEKVKAEIAPFKYGKKWAYCIEHDDGHDFAISTSLPLFAKYYFTDSPAEMPGKGKHMPLVGTVAINPVGIEAGNKGALTWKELKQLVDNGWGVANHSYWHTGVHWDPSKMNSPQQFRHEIYWGQLIISYFLFNNKSSTSGFVFPNGDYNYAKYLPEFGLSYASLCNRPIDHLLDNGKISNLPIVGRTNLDESIWKKHSEAMYCFPDESKLDGAIFVDFTHRINSDKETENYKRWEKRLSTIEKEYGGKGKDEFWCAPTYKVIDYLLARQNAKISVAPSEVSVTVPDNQNETSLTLRLDNVKKNSSFPVPKGGSVYRKGSSVWVTLPQIGKPDANVLEPELSLLYKGDFAKSVKLKKPGKIYAVRLLQTGKVNSFPEVTLVAADNQRSKIEYSDLKKFVGKKHYGKWFLIPVMPHNKPIKAKALEIDAEGKFFTSVEVWGVE